MATVWLLLIKEASTSLLKSFHVWESQKTLVCKDLLSDGIFDNNYSKLQAEDSDELITKVES